MHFCLKSLVIFLTRFQTNTGLPGALGPDMVGAKLSHADIENSSNNSSNTTDRSNNTDSSNNSDNSDNNGCNINIIACLLNCSYFTSVEIFW